MAPVHSTEEVFAVMAVLLESNKIRNATHNIMVRGQGGREVMQTPQAGHARGLRGARPCLRSATTRRTH